MSQFDEKFEGMLELDSDDPRNFRILFDELIKCITQWKEQSFVADNKFIIPTSVLVNKGLSALKSLSTSQSSVAAEELEDAYGNLRGIIKVSQIRRRNRAGSLMYRLVSTFKRPTYRNSRRELTKEDSKSFRHMSECVEAADKIEEVVYSMYSRILPEMQKSFSFFDFYVPKSSNSSDVKVLIEEAIKLIRGDVKISHQAREKLIKHLENALEILESGGDYSRFFGIIKESIFLLGALGSLAGGTVALHSASKKLEEATSIFEATSINQTYVSMDYAPTTIILQSLGLPEAPVDAVNDNSNLQE